jgi:flagellar hook-length control protein FliK
MSTIKQGLAQQRELELSKNQVEGLKSLHNKTENALAKVVLDQLHSLPKEDGNKQLWALELPFLIDNKVETLAMEIQHDKTPNAQNQQDQHWSVNLTLAPPALGNVQCVISYQNGVINTHFKNQLPETTNLISKNLDTLKQQLQNAGLISGLMTSNNSFKPLKSVYASMNQSLLNETV